jgi:hypothetical protein
MADTIPAHYTTEFSTNWIQRAQQMKARFDAFVTEENFSGERKRYDRLYKQESHERTERKAQTPVTDPSNDSRWIYRRTFDLANTLAEEDARNLAPLTLPDSKYVESHAFAYHRDCDRIVIGAAVNSALTGELGTTPTVLPAGQQIAAGGTGLTLAKLLAAVEILNGADLTDEANSRVIAVSPQQMTNLLNTTEVKSADYNTVKALASGNVDTFMGFKFIVSTLLTKVSTTRTCVAWCKGAIQRVKGGMRTSIDRLPEKSNATQIFSSWDLAAVRIYDEGVVQIDATET